MLKWLEPSFSRSLSRPWMSLKKGGQKTGLSLGSKFASNFWAPRLARTGKLPFVVLQAAAFSIEFNFVFIWFEDLHVCGSSHDISVDKSSQKIVILCQFLCHSLFWSRQIESICCFEGKKSLTDFFAGVEKRSYKKWRQKETYFLSGWPFVLLISPQWRHIIKRRHIKTSSAS